MATSQKFDALDGLEVTGQMTVGANLAIDTDTLFVDSVDDRVGINDSTPEYSLDVFGNARVTSEILVGTDIQHDGDIDTKIAFTDNQINLEAGGLTSQLVLDTTDISISNGQGLAVRGIVPTASEFQTNSNRQTGAIGANFIYTSFIEASAEKDLGSTGIAIGQIDYTGSGSWSNNNSDAIKLISGGADQYTFNSSSANFHSNDLIGVKDIAIANSLYHTSDTNTYFQFNANDSAQIVTNGSVRLVANTSGVHVVGTLDVSTDLVARRITVEDYFIETTTTAPGGTSVTIDCDAGSVVEFTPTNNYSVDFTNLPTSGTSAFTLVINNNGTAREATWPDEIEGDAIPHVRKA